jgi:hypothetical protein
MFALDPQRAAQSTGYAKRSPVGAPARAMDEAFTK